MTSQETKLHLRVRSNKTTISEFSFLYFEWWTRGNVEAEEDKNEIFDWMIRPNDVNHYIDILLSINILRISTRLTGSFAPAEQTRQRSHWKRIWIRSRYSFKMTQTMTHPFLLEIFVVQFSNQFQLQLLDLEEFSWNN